MDQETLKNRLLTAFPDASIEVHDLTGGQDHWEVAVESSAFQGLSRIQQHQKVMAVFAEELKTGEVHALSIKTKSNKEQK
jgi:stress-induced morphogen